MLDNRVQLFRIGGLSFAADKSWFFVFVLIVWLLSFAYFPGELAGESVTTYALLGFLATVGLFLSVVIHEACHAIVARRYGLPVERITLWAFGGMSEIGEEPKSASAEFYIAVVGPLASFVLAGLFYATTLFVEGRGGPVVRELLVYLWRVNLALGVFNLIPAFPLDGGRILRSMLWRWKKKLGWATQVSANVGSGFGLVMMLLGMLAFISGSLVAGIWYFLIGLFIRWAAKMSYLRMRINQALEHEPISEFMGETHNIPDNLPLPEAIHQFFYKYKESVFPVVDGTGQLVGVLSPRRLREVPAAQRPHMTVGEAAGRPTVQNVMEKGSDASEAFTRLASGRSKHLVVVDGKTPVGSLSLDDLLRVVALKLEIDGDEDGISPDLRLSASG